MGMKIAIIGAGVAGCATYLELKKHLSETKDLDVKIYEAYDTGKDVTSEDREQGPTHSSTLIDSANSVFVFDELFWDRS